MAANFIETHAHTSIDTAAGRPMLLCWLLIDVPFWLVRADTEYASPFWAIYERSALVAENPHILIRPMDQRNAFT